MPYFYILPCFLRASSLLALPFVQKHLNLFITEKEGQWQQVLLVRQSIDSNASDVGVNKKGDHAHNTSSTIGNIEGQLAVMIISLEGVAKSGPWKIVLYCPVISAFKYISKSQGLLFPSHRNIELDVVIRTSWLQKIYDNYALWIVKNYCPDEMIRGVILPSDIGLQIYQ